MTTPKLTKRQAEILVWVQRGLSNKQIANRIGITDSTIKLHVTALLKKYGVRNRTQLSAYSTQGKMPDLPDMPEDVEARPCGWIKRVGNKVQGVVFTQDAPDDTWQAIYAKRK